MVLQGPRDADPLGSQHPWIDDRTLTCHSTIRTPERQETYEKTVQRDCDTHGSMICHKEALKISLCTGITLQLVRQKESKMPQTGTGNYYERRRNELQDRLAKPGISANDVISYAPADVLSNPLEVKCLRSPKSKLPEPSDQTDCSEAHVLLSSTSRPYEFTDTLHRYTETSSMSDLAFPRLQKSTEYHEVLRMPGRQVHRTIVKTS